jgi:hypothetical protein
MNYEETIKSMLTAASTAAKGKWKDLRAAAEQEFRSLGVAAARIEADFLADSAAAALQSDPAKRTEMAGKAKLRAELAFDSLKLAAEGVTLAAKVEAKLAAQNATNAALGILGAAVTKSIGIALL